MDCSSTKLSAHGFANQSDAEYVTGFWAQETENQSDHLVGEEEIYVCITF